MIGGATVKIAATAANESWKPGSKTRYGFHARSATAPSSRTYHASRSLPVNHANEATAPAIAARTTDGCGPTATTYAAIAPRTPISAIQREIPISHASARTAPATKTTF